MSDELKSCPFDTKNKNDLSSFVLSQLKKNKNNDTYKLLSLFDSGLSLSVDQLIVGFYRKYGTVKERKWFIYTLYNCKNEVEKKQNKWNKRV